MLPPVYAASAVNLLSTSGADGRDARRGVAISSTVQAAGQLASQPSGLQPETVKALQQLAELLGSKNISANDILTKLATDFAALIGEMKQPNESAQAFAGRLADIILQMKPERQAAAENASGFKQIGISALAFAGALKDPSSAAAARIVALIENPAFNAAEHALKAAISSYEQNSSVGPEIAATQKMANKVSPSQEEKTQPQQRTTTSAEGSSKEPIGTSKGNGHRPTTAQPHQASTQSAQAEQTTNSGATTSKTSVHPEQPKADGAERAPDAAAQRAPASQKVQTAEVRLQTESPSRTHSEGQHPMQVLRGFNVVLSTEALLKPSDANPTAKATVSAPTGKAGEHATIVPISDWLKNISTDEVAQRAHQAAKAMEGKIIALFANTSRNGEVGNSATDQQNRQASLLQQGAASKAATDSDPDLPRLLARLPEAVPFAQIPFPPAQNEKRTGARYGYPNRGREERPDSQSDGGEQSMQQHDQGQQRDDIEHEEKPFEADTPLVRNASDAERAYHMYQRFGGF
jgi:hypothetical protein